MGVLGCRLSGVFCCASHAPSKAAGTTDKYPIVRYHLFREDTGREEIGLLRDQDVGVREIARLIGRSPSTVSREFARNAATRGCQLEYRASIAQWKEELVARRP